MKTEYEREGNLRLRQHLSKESIAIIYSQEPILKDNFEKKLENTIYELTDLKSFFGEYLDKVNWILEGYDNRIKKLEEKA